MHWFRAMTEALAVGDLPAALEAVRPMAKRHKFHAKPCYVIRPQMDIVDAEDVEYFHSRKEATRFVVLDYLLRAEKISNLRRQVPFVIGNVGGKDVKYVADFTFEENGKTIVEDVKGMTTREYLRKKKAMLAVHGIEVREV